MTYLEYTKRMKEVHIKLLEFLDDTDNNEEKYQNLIDMLDQSLKGNKHELKSFLHLIYYISRNHYRGKEFLKKIDQILKYLKNDILNNISNFMVFNIFKKSKAILLILIEQEVLIIDKSIADIMINSFTFNYNYDQFFLPEIAPFLEKDEIQNIILDYSDNNIKIKKSNDDNTEEDSYYTTDDDNTEEEEKETEVSNSGTDSKNANEELNNDNNELNQKNDFKDSNHNKINNDQADLIKKLPELFFEKRKIGENDNEICRIIREDLIEDFIIYINKNEYPIYSKIKPSIYETHSLLINEELTLIEYAAFFGSIQIFKYLYLNKAEIKESIWIYGIHGNNPEIISFLEEKSESIIQNDDNYFEYLKESIKCHHNDMAYYFQNNYLKTSNETVSNDFDFENNVFYYGFHYNNYAFFPSELNNHIFIFDLCKYDYYTLVESILKNKGIDIKDTVIIISIL